MNESLNRMSALLQCLTTVTNDNVNYVCTLYISHRFRDTTTYRNIYAPCSNLNALTGHFTWSF